MNVQAITMQMDARSALAHYKEYRKRVRQNRELRLKEAARKIHDGNATMRAGRAERSQVEKEDELLMASYRAMANGQRILNAASVLQGAGLNPATELPALAIGRASWPKTHLVVNAHGPSVPQLVFSDQPWPRWDYRHTKWQKGAIGFRQDLFGTKLTNNEWRRNQPRGLMFGGRYEALTPSIPPQLRPFGDLSEYFILWEAVWEKSAPVDPLLLKHLGGQLYTVLAQWDLTPIERAVLEGRIT